MILSIVLPMVGGLGLFLYGMRLMGDSIERAAGAKLRGILERITSNRVVGMLQTDAVLKGRFEFSLKNRFFIQYFCLYLSR